MDTFVIILALCALAGFLGWQRFATNNAVATTSVRSPHDVRRTQEIVDAAFGGARAMLWTTASGPGNINKRRRGKDRGITMSIDIEAIPGGGSQVDMWASQTNVYFGLFVNFSGAVNSRKMAISRHLTS
ncbi:hypothetical protein [Amycolatopsis sp. NBC_00438]|uniref:hypothetical protein n=1 Tax=Amycolatopsis sp. NBC_00438 TaxID=2903558 RepID=UPI002E24C542